MANNGNNTTGKIITLLTDFGTVDPYVGAMKGVLMTAAPGVPIVDICHDVPPHNVLAAAFIIAQVAPYFPKETIHVIVVDPGVGTDRRILAARMADQTYLFPDNGVISFIAAALPMQAMAVVLNTKYLPPIMPSMTFQGRDVFAPVAAHLARGVPIAELGPQPDSYKLLELPHAVAENGHITGRVIYVDRFGNLITDIPQGMLEVGRDLACLHVFCNGDDAGPLQATYALVDSGMPLALFNSMGLLEIAVNQGRACDFFSAGVGAPVVVKC
jgi:S-adenosylmethionine hydrolase